MVHISIEDRPRDAYPIDTRMETKIENKNSWTHLKRQPAPRESNREQSHVFSFFEMQKNQRK